VPEFEVDNPSSPSQTTALRHWGYSFASFGEYARASLGTASPPPTIHIAWVQKTLITVESLPSNSREAMAFRFVDPRPFIPNGAQRIMVPSRPLMKRVVTGRVHK
jgi:hypothetical protein